MALSVVLLFNVAATLGGGVVTTLGHGSTTLVVGASIGGGVLCCSAMIAVSSWMAQMCVFFAAVNVGTVSPKYLE